MFKSLFGKITEQADVSPKTSSGNATAQSQNATAGGPLLMAKSVTDSRKSGATIPTTPLAANAPVEKPAAPKETAKTPEPPKVSIKKPEAPKPKPTPAPAPAPATPTKFAAARPAKAMYQVVTAADIALIQAQVELAKQYMKAKKFDNAIDLLTTAEQSNAGSRDVYRLLGECLFVQKRWRESLTRWYKAATLTDRNDEKMLRIIKLKVMRCNAQLSLLALAEGDKITAAERLSQSIEAIDFSTYVKVRKDMIKAITAYVNDKIAGEYPAPALRSTSPKRIAICLDLIKISPVHTHKHLYLSLSAALASLDPDITIDIIATYERQLTWNAGFEDYYRPNNKAVLEAFIEEMVPEGIRERITVRYFESFGLRGLINTCREMLDLKYDLILYGSGKHGYHGNESLLVRHVLYPYTPTVFFFVQSNNEVDDRNDVIVARGRHPIEGEPKNVRIDYKAYPPFPGLQAAVVPEGLGTVKPKNKNIVTAWVGVRLDKTLNAYSEADINKILTLLDKVPNAIWHLVGADDPSTLLIHHKKFTEYRKKKRIIVHPVLTYREFYKVASRGALFFQPPGFTGGGGGASIARNASIPILCFRHSDVAPLQPQDFVFEEEDLTGGVNAALKILTNEKASTALVDRQIELMEARRSSAPADFYESLKAAVEIYNARTTAAAE